ncbi:hypothetical protein OJ252_1082, partial [Cryptosporidium canis]
CNSAPHVKEDGQDNPDSGSERKDDGDAGEDDDREEGVAENGHGRVQVDALAAAAHNVEEDVGPNAAQDPDPVNVAKVDLPCQQQEEPETPN